MSTANDPWFTAFHRFAESVNGTADEANLSITAVVNYYEVTVSFSGVGVSRFAICWTEGVHRSAMNLARQRTTGLTIGMIFDLVENSKGYALAANGGSLATVDYHRFMNGLTKIANGEN